MLVDCAHDGYRDIRSRYDSERGVLFYFWTCECCTTRLGEAAREEYRPRYDPGGNDEFLAALRGGAGG